MLQLSLYGWHWLPRCQTCCSQGVATSGVHGAPMPDAAEKQARSARSSEASLHTLGSAGSAGVPAAHAGDAWPRAPASARAPQQRHEGAGRRAELSSSGGSGARLRVLQDSPLRASPSDSQAVALPQGAEGSSTAASLSQVPGGRDNMILGSLMGGREVDAPAAERDRAGGKGCTPFPGVCVGMDGQERARVSTSASVPQNRTAAAPGEGAGPHNGVRRRRGPNPFSPAGR